MHGICILSQIPCRKEPSDRSEMVTQLLFGESYTVFTEQEKWIQIKTAYDQYECWISEKQFFPIAGSTFERLNSNPQPCSTELVQVLTNSKDQSAFPIVCGSSLPNLNEGKCKIEELVFSYEGQVSGNSNPGSLQKGIIEAAYLYLNSPYLWGGRSPFGIDCSGFTQMVFKINGVKIPRDAAQQAALGQALDFVEEVQAGDLAFFDDKEGKITHVGIVLPEKKIIHASGCVRVDSLDHHGIFNAEIGGYSHNLRVLKRIRG